MCMSVQKHLAVFKITFNSVSQVYDSINPDFRSGVTPVPRPPSPPRLTLDDSHYLTKRPLYDIRTPANTPITLIYHRSFSSRPHPLSS